MSRDDLAAWSQYRRLCVVGARLGRPEYVTDKATAASTPERIQPSDPIELTELMEPR
jgi:hypothetical protein